MHLITHLQGVAIFIGIDNPGLALQNNNDATCLSGDLRGSHG
jgi:hypothetical protein